MKNPLQNLIFVACTVLLTGCMAAGPLIGAVAAPILMNKVTAKQFESKPPKYIEIAQEGRIITASFETGGFRVGTGQAAQMRGFEEWATAAVVREAPKRGCVNVINAFSSASGTKASSTIGSTKLASTIRFKCLEKENVMSEQDLLSDKQVIYSEQINYINQHPSMIRYK